MTSKTQIKERIDWWNLVAIRHHGMPLLWRWFSLNADEKPEDFVEVKGAVPIGTNAEGRPVWGNDHNVIWIRLSEIEAEKKTYEENTGNCSSCQGTGQTVCRVSKDGTEYRECRKCSGKGVLK